MSVPAPQPSSPSTAGAVAACTIIARNYLSYAAILAESYLRHEPGGRFYVLVVDGLPPKAALPEGVHLVAADELGLPAFHDMCFKYDVTELCTAVKPALLSLLLTRYAEPAVAYFDPDIVILRPLDELKEALRAADIVLIPHVLDPIPRDGKKPSEQDILIAGAYNLGFVAVRATPEAGRLLAWWGDRLEDGCRVDPAHGLFVDQRWMDLVPSLFPSTAVLRDPTYDVAYWNLHTRMPARGPSGFEVDGRPLAFFHFSGFDPRRPETLSRHQTRVTVEPGSALAELLEGYAARHERHGHAACSRWTYGYSRFSNGVSVGLVFRHLYLGLDETARRRFGNPFVADGNGSFYGWAVRPQPELGGLNPFLETLYAIRADLPPAFPDHHGGSRAAYLRWAREQGAREMGFPAIIVPDPAGSARAAAGPPATAPGVNVAGYLRNETGIGAVARGYVAALQSAGVPVALKDFSELSPNRSEDPTLTGFDDVHPHPVNLLCANADEYFVVASHLGDGFLRNRTNVGVWFWELPEFPVDWHDRFAHYDEIWAPTSFIANTLSAVSPIPIVRVPAVLTAEPGGDRDRGRARLGVAEGEFLWLVIFDFHSYFERKNPLAMVEAFKQAYGPSHPARLVIKCVNSAFDPESRARLDEAARGHRIAIHDGYWSLGEMRDLLSACDGYASLHRSEGLGIPLANAMSLGKPVVATAWSGNTDFMSVGNSFPVRYDVVELPHDVGPYRAGRAWAEPSVEHAAELLRTVSAGGREVAARAAAGQATIAARYSVEAVGRAVRDRLEVLARRPARPAVADAPVVAAPNGSAPATPAPATADDFQPALPALDLEKSQFGLLGRWGKRAAALVLRYHAFHQRRVNEILARAIGDAASQVSALSSRVEHGRAEARAGADRALSAVGALEARTRETAAAVHATRASLEQRLSEADARVARLLAEHEQTAERVRALAEEAGAWRPRVEHELRRTFEHAHGLDLRLDAVGGRLDAV
ncbi:MAG TPA: glycosyltransferase, partial [Vicinamibacteria bacterium]